MTATVKRKTGHGRAGWSILSTHKSHRRLLPALIAGSACGLIAGPSSALQLGELEVQSTLGQPLRASIAFALNPNEQLFNHCVRLGSGKSPDGLPMLRNTTLSIANGTILLTGNSPLREPMIAVQIAVDCAYTANLTRAYTIMLDPARPFTALVANKPATASVAPQPVIKRSPATPPSMVETAPIPLHTQYTVQVGDTLSGIATRIENRPLGLWPAVNAIFAANPDAFINNDINRLRAGSRLTIPGLDNITAPTLSSNIVTPEPVAAVAEPVPAASAVYSGYVADDTATVLESTTLSGADAVDETPVSAPVLPAVTAAPSMATIQPGDISLGGGSAFVSPIEAAVEAPVASTDPQQPTVTEALAAQPTAVVAVVASEPGTNSLDRTSGNWSWMFWLAGSGMALILGLLLFGRKLRDRFGSIAIGAPVEPVMQDDDETARNETLSEVDFPIQDTRSSGQEYVLDADLGAGTGLNDNGDIAVAQDFGFAANGDSGVELDLLLPEEVAQEPESHPTDIIPPQRLEDTSILVAEELPEDDDEYDLSMIVDATKQHPGDDASTEKDLHAVPFDRESDDDFDVECTLNDNLGIDALEQDYEDELTATQAANKEIEKAAAELTLRMLESSADKTSEMPVTDSDDDTVEGKTAEMPGAGGTAEITSEVTVQMPSTAQATNEEFADPDDTGINDELTAQLPAAENDPTTEMVVESGRLNSKKSAG